VPATSDSLAEARNVALRRRLSWLYAIAGVALHGVTWRLWTAQTVFPQIPLAPFTVAAPRWLDPLALVGMAAGLVLSAFDRRRRIGWIVFAACWFVSVLLDQHRIQVWAYHLAIAGLLIALTPENRWRSRLQQLTIGIYLWSAISKIDAAFLVNQGPMLVGGLFHSLGGDFSSFSEVTRRTLIEGMIAGEIMTALLLVWSRTRGFGLAASIVMHLALISTLGPWGLNHEPAVLIWNAMFIAQNWMLFSGQSVSRTVASKSPAVKPQITAPDLISSIVLALAVGMPAGVDRDIWDVWPSWAVYSSRGGWTTASVFEEDLAQLPESLREFVRDAEPMSKVRVIDVDRWSLKTLGCPVYPQSRFRQAVAAAISRYAPLRVELRSPPDRQTGQSDFKSILLPKQSSREGYEATVRQALQQEFWLNLLERAKAGEK
jgi:hypothetical protein